MKIYDRNKIVKYYEMLYKSACRRADLSSIIKQKIVKRIQNYIYVHKQNEMSDLC